MKIKKQNSQLEIDNIKYGPIKYGLNLVYFSFETGQSKLYHFDTEVSLGLNEIATFDSVQTRSNCDAYIRFYISSGPKPFGLNAAVSSGSENQNF